MNGPLDKLQPKAHTGLVHVVVDTPKGSRYKFKYDEDAQCFSLGRILPAGACFPHDFGSIPQTLAEDGDALDVVVLGPAASFPGCLIRCKLIGGIRAKQTEKGKTIRNDRLLAVPVTKANPAEFSNIAELPAAWVRELEHFFVSYNQAHGREFKPLGRMGPGEAEQALAAAVKRYRKKK
jgi:inorganic pyrophosphatase